MNPSTYEQWLLKLGPLGLTFVLVIAFGYVVRLIPLRINWLIPMFAPAIGGLSMWLIAPKNFVGDGWNHPQAVLIIYGIIVGVVAWAAHALIISKIEDAIRARVPAVDKLFNNTSDDPAARNPDRIV